MLMAAIVYCCGVLLYVIWDYKSREEILMHEIDSKLLIAARSIKYLLSEDFHDRAIAPDSIKFEEEIKNRSKINRFNFESSLKWTYTIVEYNGNFYFSAPTVTEDEARERKSWYFYPYEDIPDEFRKAFYERKIYFVEYSDKWGTFRSVAVPEVSPSGRVYLACADYEISYVKSILRKNLYHSITTSLYFILFLLPFIFVLRNSYKRYADELKLLNDELFEHKNNLEELVEARTKELSSVNEKLKEEFDERLKAELKLREESEKLNKAILEINSLRDMLPICASCKKIRDDKGYWQQIEKYIQENSNIIFTHGICPDCARKLYGDIHFTTLKSEEQSDK